MAQAALTYHTPLSTSLTFDVQYQRSCSILSKESAADIKKALEEGNLLEVVSLARGTLETVCRTPVNIAVTGDSGNGMSSFINALRKIGHEEEYSAPTGVVRTTQTRTGYTYSLFPNVELWDLPGTGAAYQSLENYLEQMQFSQYNLIIIIASEQFSMNLVKLAKSFQELSKKFYIVWTKLDRDLSTRILSEEQLLQNIQNNIRETLQKEGVCEPPIFLVSSFSPLLHDFPKLRDTLHRDISDIRCNGPLKNISLFCEKVISHKVTTCQGEIDSKSPLDTFGIQNSDDLEKCLYDYHVRFGVDDDTLQQVAQSLGKPMEEYKATMKSQDLQTALIEDWVLSLINCNTASYFYAILNYVRIIGDPCIHSLRYWNHKRLLELVAEDTKTILRKFLRDSII